MILIWSFEYLHTISLRDKSLGKDYCKSKATVNYLKSKYKMEIGHAPTFCQQNAPSARLYEENAAFGLYQDFLQQVLWSIFSAANFKPIAIFPAP